MKRIINYVFYKKDNKNNKKHNCNEELNLYFIQIKNN